METLHDPIYIIHANTYQIHTKTTKSNERKKNSMIQIKTYLKPMSHCTRYLLSDNFIFLDGGQYYSI